VASITKIGFLVILFSVSTLCLSKANDLFDITRYKGKIVYIDFWASWCIPCRKSFPWMNQLRAKYSKKQLYIIGINLDKKPEKVHLFLTKYPANFDIFYDSKAIIAKKYKILGMPSSVLLDQNGDIILTHQGFFEKKIPQYEQEISTAILSLTRKGK
jgi:thiol-disulfide isomerase/thioredoxin